MPVEEAPNDDDVRQSYNFAPGYHGLVYRAEGSGHNEQKEHEHDNEGNLEKESTTSTKYKLQSMQWGGCCEIAFRVPSLTSEFQALSRSGRSVTQTTARR
jgi:hypothetical protein